MKKREATAIEEMVREALESYEAKRVKEEKQLISRAAEAAITAYEKRKERDERKRFDRRLHNTKFLLEHYRDFSSYSESAISEIYEGLDDDIFDVMEHMEGRIADRDRRVESIEKGVMRTRIIMKHVDTMLEVYKKSCYASLYPENVRRYRVIKAMYLDKEAQTVKEIAESEGINERTVYKDVTAACSRLTALIFGIDGYRKG